MASSLSLTSQMKTSLSFSFHLSLIPSALPRNIKFFRGEGGGSRLAHSHTEAQNTANTLKSAHTHRERETEREEKRGSLCTCPQAYKPKQKKENSAEEGTEK